MAFNLDQTITRIEQGIPERVWTANGYHNRVPGVCWDDKELGLFQVFINSVPQAETKPRVNTTAPLTN